jgi:hypothetical protein
MAAIYHVNAVDPSLRSRMTVTTGDISHSRKAIYHVPFGTMVPYSFTTFKDDGTGVSLSRWDPSTSLRSAQDDTKHSAQDDTEHTLKNDGTKYYSVLPPQRLRSNHITTQILFC